VAAARHRRQDELDLLGLAEHDGFDVGQEALRDLSGPANAFFSFDV
jgi:hypothetical protein